MDFLIPVSNVQLLTVLLKEVGSEGEKEWGREREGGRERERERERKKERKRR